MLEPEQDFLWNDIGLRELRLPDLGGAIAQIRDRNVYQRPEPHGADEPYIVEYAFVPGIGIAEWKFSGTYLSDASHQVLTSFCRPDIGCIP